MPTYIVIHTLSTLQVVVIESKSTLIQTPPTPDKSPTSGLIWPR